MLLELDMSCVSETGYLELIIGPMFSGKTSSLVDIYKHYLLYNQNVCIVNYDMDKRYSEDKLMTHDKVGIDCMFLESLSDIASNDYDIILINEGQFFEDIVDVVKKWVDEDGKRIHIAALDGDYKRQPFKVISELIPLCDSLVKRKALCIDCKDGTEAIFSLRYHDIGTGEVVQIGGSDTYKPVCRICYQKYFTKQSKECSTL